MTIREGIKKLLKEHTHLYDDVVARELEELFQFRLRDSLERVRLAGEDFYGWGDKQERYDWGYSDGLKAAVSEQNKKIATEIKGLGGKE